MERLEGKGEERARYNAPAEKKAEEGSAHLMSAEQVRPGMRVRVMDHHRVEQRRDLVGTVVARYGGEDYMAVDVHLGGGQYRLFWPSDLEEIPSSPKAWWRLLLGWASAG